MSNIDKTDRFRQTALDESSQRISAGAFPFRKMMSGDDFFRLSAMDEDNYRCSVGAPPYRDITGTRIFSNEIEQLNHILQKLRNELIEDQRRRSVLIGGRASVAACKTIEESAGDIDTILSQFESSGHQDYIGILTVVSFSCAMRLTHLSASCSSEREQRRLLDMALEMSDIARDIEKRLSRQAEFNPGEFYDMSDLRFQHEG